MGQIAIGEKIRNVRRRKHMTQRKLAELIGCKSSFVSHIEHNSRNISISYLKRIADALETPAYRLVSSDDDRTTRALALLEGLDESHLSVALDYLEYLREQQNRKLEEKH